MDRARALDSPLESVSDAQIIARSVGEPDCFAAIFDRHFVEIHRYVTHRLGVDLADDVAAETFYQAFRLRQRYETERVSARPWLYGIATNLVRRHRRQEVRALRALERLDPRTPVDRHEDLAIARVSAERMRGRIAGALRHLSQGDREVLLLVALADLTYDEVASALGIAYGTVCSRLSRARRTLRGLLTPADVEEIRHG